MKYYHVLIAFFLVRAGLAAELQVLPEHLRPDPFGGIVAADLYPGAGALAPVALQGARAGYVSFHLVVKSTEPGAFDVGVNLEDKAGKLQVDLYREWFHYRDAKSQYIPDALIPVRAPVSAQVPDAENRIDKQTALAFWVDIWIPHDALPGAYKGEAWLKSKGRATKLPLTVRVLPAVVPDSDAVVMDHNSYGISWLGELYPAEGVAPGGALPHDKLFRLIHQYHRLFYEHRGTYHQLGYGHGGRVIPEFAPGLTGSGRGRRIESWDLFDRHYGPLLDGSAFAGSRRGTKPIPFVYLPINPEWPATFLGWGEAGYEAEFVSVVATMERHFREKGWTKTNFEMFFNHKKRYKAFPWDGDEARFPEDDRYLLEYARLLKRAVPAGSPVHFVFRSDSSWSIERQFKSLAGAVNFWVCGWGLASWFPDSLRAAKSRGDIVWIYGGAPDTALPSSAITENVLRTWLYGIDGFVHWQTVDQGSDPWFHFNGGSTALAYSGHRFGTDGPIPSLRLKIQRNCVQDIALFKALEAKKPGDQLKAEVTSRYDRTAPADWWTPRPALADRPPWEWTNSSIDEAMKAVSKRTRTPESRAWSNVRAYLMTLAAEEK